MVVPVLCLSFWFQSLLCGPFLVFGRMASDSNRYIDGLGGIIQETGNFGIFLYGTLERLLILTDSIIWSIRHLYTSLGGVAEVGGQVFEGARNIYFAAIAGSGSKAAPAKCHLGCTRTKMFGLFGACLAMYQTAKPENRVKVSYFDPSSGDFLLLLG